MQKRLKKAKQIIDIIVKLTALLHKYEIQLICITLLISVYKMKVNITFPFTLEDLFSSTHRSLSSLFLFVVVYE